MKSVETETGNSLILCIRDFVRSRCGRTWLNRNRHVEKDELINDLFLLLTNDERFRKTFEKSTDQDRRQKWTHHRCKWAVHEIRRRSCYRPFISWNEAQTINLYDETRFYETVDQSEVVDQSIQMSKLATELREIVKLRLIGWNQSKISQTLGISRKTVRRRLDAAAIMLGLSRRSRSI